MCEDLTDQSNLAKLKVETQSKTLVPSGEICEFYVAEIRQIQVGARAGETDVYVIEDF